MHSSMFHSLPCAVYNIIVIRILKYSLLSLQYMYIKERKSCCIVNCNGMLSFMTIYYIVYIYILTLVMRQLLQLMNMCVTESHNSTSEMLPTHLYHKESSYSVDDDVFSSNASKNNENAPGKVPELFSSNL